MFASPARIPVQILQIITGCINQIQASDTQNFTNVCNCEHNKENTIPDILINNNTK
jgi:hypothetical protein